MPATLREVLRVRRLEKKYTLNEMGKRLNLANGNFIGMVERGERLPSDAKLLQLAEVLELDGKEMLALKYKEIPDSAVHQLFSAPSPLHPTTRRMLLATCLDREGMEREFRLGEKTTLERIVFGYLLDFVILDSVVDSKVMPTLRKRLIDFERRRNKNQDAAFDPWWFEEEGDTFVAFAKEQFVGWSLDMLELTLTIQHSDSPTDRSIIPLIDVDLRDRLIQSVGRDVASRSGLHRVPTLENQLRAEGLSEADVEEILALVEFKKARMRRSADRSEEMA
jgi:transcriptional regulator with XRE-family HTH domain